MYLSHFLDAVGEDVGDDNPLLRRRLQVHLHQDYVVEQHQVSHVCQLHANTTLEKNQEGHGFVCVFVWRNQVHFPLCKPIRAVKGSVKKK